MSTTGVPGGLPSHDYSDVPDKVVGAGWARTPHARRSCRDKRPYVVVPWTFPSATHGRRAPAVLDRGPGLLDRGGARHGR